MKVKEKFVAGVAAGVTLLALATLASAQKQDRLSDADGGPRTVRTIPITPSFDQRWFGPAAADRWIGNQPPPSDRFTPGAAGQRAGEQNAPAGLPAAVGIVPVPGNRLRHDPIREQVPVPKARKLAEAPRDVCERHNLRKVWQGRSWRCR